MMKHRLYILIFFLLPVILSCSRRVEMSEYRTTAALPELSPDYTHLVIPPNIAPLNFSIKEAGERYFVKIYADSSQAISILSQSPAIQIPVRKWRDLLQQHQGDSIFIDVYVCDVNKKWIRYQRISHQIASEAIDRFLVYRFLRPNYTVQQKMTIRQRDLSCFKESLVMTTKSIGACINCHSFNHHDPDEMLMHVRWGPAAGTLFVKNQRIFKIDTRTEFNSSPGAYAAWHPNGQLVVFSVNKVYQFFHAAGMSRDVIDLSSDLIVYQIETNTVSTDSAIASPTYMETYPTWSPDGAFLYFCSAPQLPADFLLERDYRDVKYDLKRVAYNVENDEWGEPETLFSAAEMNKSCTLPRISPDGKYLLFSLSDYGNFPILNQSSDLCVMNLQTRAYQKLGINSHRAEGYHSWSSNGHWIVFTSKRDNDIFTRIYLSYVDDQYHFHKPFILPQENPELDGSLFYAYSVPELVIKAVPFRAKQFLSTALNPKKERKANIDPKVMLHLKPEVEKDLETTDYP